MLMLPVVGEREIPPVVVVPVDVVVTVPVPVTLVDDAVTVPVAVVPDIVLEKSHEWAAIAINGKRTAEAIAL